MSELITPAEAAGRPAAADRIGLICHRYPDGDTVGSAYALCLALRRAGKRATVIGGDGIPAKYGFLTALADTEEFEPAFLCAVDVADVRLMEPDTAARYGDRVDLCIDHHGTNVQYARALLVQPEAAAAAIPMAQVIRTLGIAVDRDIAACLYTALATDTGCFKYSNVTPDALRLAADWMETGIDAAAINRRMFDTKSRAHIALEQMALAGIRYRWGGRCAVMTITREMIARSGADENDMGGFASLPRQIEGVWVGCTLREVDGGFKISIRTDGGIDAAAIGAQLGGGGHRAAAGCTVNAPADEAAEAIEAAILRQVPAIQD